MAGLDFKRSKDCEARSPRHRAGARDVRAPRQEPM